jgi:superfamily I DNA/RNA helicase/CRISPR/Cas system-associated exonuclease Cas4 (RecB family)
MNELNENQSAVVEASIDRPAKVVAGAGTGKTRVLVERYLRFLRDGVPPSRLLALTFTLKAADEMRQRIFEEVERGLPHLMRDLYAAWIMNFHAFGFRVIRENAPAFGIDPGVDVASEAELRRIERLLESRFLAGRIEGVPNDFGGEIPPPAGLRSLFDIYLGVVKKCRGDLVSVENLLWTLRDDDAEPYRASVGAIASVYDAFTMEMARQNLIDFNDMIGLAASGLAGDDQLAAHYRNRFDHILVDEFQDTSAAQFELLRVLSDDRYSKVTVVGDEKQSIYRWRDARVENIREFPGDDLPLSINYRSRQNILDLAHAFVCKDDVLAKTAVKLTAHRTEPGKPIVLFHPDDDQKGQQNDIEAKALAAWVAHVTGGLAVPGAPDLIGDQPLDYGDVVVLLRGVRVQKVVPAIERAFRSAGLPYVILGGSDAAGARALEVLYAYLSLLLPGDRRMPLLHVLESRPFNVGHATLVELFGEDGNVEGSFGEPLDPGCVSRVTDAVARASLERFDALYRRLAAAHLSKDFRGFLADAFECTPFLTRLFAEGATMRAAEDLIGELWDICDTLDAKRELGLWSFLDHLRAAIDGRTFGKVEQLAVPPGHVRVMTVHQAKGLEFKAVAVAGIKPSRHDSEGFFLSKTTGVYSQRWAEWGRGYDATDERELEKEMKLQEERCLLYVAMTRAEDYLFVSSPYADGGKSMFADILAAAEVGDFLSVVLRSAPGDVHAIPPEGIAAPTDSADTDALTTEWSARNELIARDADAVPVAPGAVHFVNYTALMTYADCPRRFRYRYIHRVSDGLAASVPGYLETPDEEQEELENVRLPRGVTPAGYGILVHELLRELMEKRQEGTSPPQGWIEAAAKTFGLPGKRIGEVTANAARLVDSFLSSEVASPGHDMRLEERFQVRLDRAVYHGDFDRVERTSNGWLVTDYKIGREREVYEFQVAFYAWALGKITGAGGVAGRLCYLRENETVVRTVEDRPKEIESIAGELENSLSSGWFDAAPGDLCARCPYHLSCVHSVADHK